MQLFECVIILFAEQTKLSHPKQNIYAFTEHKRIIVNFLLKPTRPAQLGLIAPSAKTIRFDREKSVRPLQSGGQN